MKVEIRSKRDPRRTKLVPANEARVLVKLGRWDYATGALEAGPPRRHPDSLGGVDFASPAAAEAARAAGLRASAFEGRHGSGAGGAFTKPDVIVIVADWS